MKTKLKLVTSIKNEKFTEGKLFVDDDYFSYTLEDTVRDKNNDGDLADAGEAKVFGETAIPSGTYKVVLSMSTRFKKILPEVLNVPGFKGIRIHGGNKTADSLGCILVAKNTDHNGRIWESASDELVRKLSGLIEAGSELELQVIR